MTKRGGGLTLAIALLSLTFAAYPLWSDWWRAKSMSVVVASASPLISSGTDDSDLQLFVGAQHLENPYLVLIRISNDGGSEITSRDFESPISIGFGAAKVVKVSRASSDEGLVHSALEAKNATVIVQPTLFNVGDHLDLAILTTGAIPRVTADTRIVGVKRVSVTAAPRPRRPSAFVGALDLIAMSVLSICAGIFGSRTAFRDPKSVLVSDRAGLAVAWAAFMGAMATAIKGLSPFSDNASNLGTFISIGLIAVTWFVDRKLLKIPKTKQG